MGFTVKTTDKMRQYPSGMHRGDKSGKPDYTLIHIPFLTRLAEHLKKGADIYGRGNWKLANSQEELTDFEAAALRHLLQWINGETEEDHAMATVFNIMCAEYVKDKLKKPTWDEEQIREIRRLMNKWVDEERLLKEKNNEHKRY